jgi:hypothetical protein
MDYLCAVRNAVRRVGDSYMAGDGKHARFRYERV